MKPSEGKIDIYSEGVDRYAMTISQEGIWNRVSKKPDVWELDLGICNKVHYKCQIIKGGFSKLQFVILADNNNGFESVAEEDLRSRSIIGAIEEVSKYFMECNLPVDVILAAKSIKKKIFEDGEIDETSLVESAGIAFESFVNDDSEDDLEDDDLDDDDLEDDDLEDDYLSNPVKDLDFKNKRGFGRLRFKSRKNPDEPKDTSADIQSILESKIKERNLYPNVQIMGEKIIAEAHESEMFYELDDPIFTLIIERTVDFKGTVVVDSMGNRRTYTFSSPLELEEAVITAIQQVF